MNKETMNFDIIYIIGGGPIGLLTGILLSKEGFETKIFEEDSIVGYPQHCSGIVSKKVASFYPINMSQILVNKLYGVRLIVNDEIFFEFKSSIPKGFIIDRIALEKQLYERYEKLGGKLKLKRRVNTDILKNGIWINAGGAKELIKSGYKKVLIGLQYDILCHDLDYIDRKIVNIHIDKRINPDYFNWIAPLSWNKFRIGSASKRGIRRIVNTLVKKICYKQIFKVEKELSGFIIYGGPRNSFVNRNMVYVGDSAGMTKITTGGGLIYGAIGSHILANCFTNNNLSEYRAIWLSLIRRELVLQKLLRYMYIKIPKKILIDILSTLSRNEFFEKLLLLGDMDFHASSLFKLLLEKDFVKALKFKYK